MKEQKGVLLSDLLTLDISSESIISNYKSGLLSNLQSIIAVNQQIVTTQVYESNEKTVNDIFLNAIVNQNGVFTAQQLQDLLNIALQCPQTGGMAVYRARGLLPSCIHIEHEETFDNCFPDSTEGFSSSNLLSNTFDEIDDDKIHIYPNPASGEINIRFNKNSSGTVIISDPFRRKMMQRNIFENENFVSLELNLLRGIYQCTILWDDGSMQTESLIIE
ncbi:MAG: T9SS type A sorting domain-containing protein [Chitinophagales bacterium]|nr:T9SS type A sorting domain-containing protein [Chitinophagales bacterium]